MSADRSHSSGNGFVILLFSAYLEHAHDTHTYTLKSQCSDSLSDDKDAAKHRISEWGENWGFVLYFVCLVCSQKQKQLGINCHHHMNCV